MGYLKLLDLLSRLANAILKSFNKSRVKAAIDNPADTIADGGSVQQSERTFTDLAAKNGRDKTE